MQRRCKKGVGGEPAAHVHVRRISFPPPLSAAIVGNLPFIDYGWRNINSCAVSLAIYVAVQTQAT